jgi:predicted DNA-binding WGR domain protein
VELRGIAPARAPSPQAVNQSETSSLSAADRAMVWEAKVARAVVVVRFGRIGTAGQTPQKLFADEAMPRRTAERLVPWRPAKG